MREIKFRGWNKFQEVMVYDEEDGTDDYFDGICMTEIGFINDRLALPDNEDFIDSSIRRDYVIMQYTGLNDKNGTEIYEGDIVELEGAFSKEFRTIVFEQGTFHFGYLRDGMCDHKEMTVTGNIYDNPDLLEG